MGTYLCVASVVEGFIATKGEGHLFYMAFTNSWMVFRNKRLKLVNDILLKS
jgi:hypothetical protein